MADFSEMLNGILSNPQAMQQMMALAQSLGLQGQGGQPQQSAPTPPPPPPQLPQQPSQPGPVQHLRFASAADKNVPTNCICSGVP